MQKNKPHLISFAFFLLSLLLACQPLSKKTPTSEIPQEVSSDTSNRETAFVNPETNNEDDPREITTGYGMTRLLPYPIGTLVTLDVWQIEVRELLRGAEALATLQESNSAIIPPGDGMEYILAKVFLRCVALDDSANDIGIYEMAITGSSHMIYGDQLDELPQPEFLYKDMFTAEKVEGWIDAIVPVGETDLMLVVDLNRSGGTTRITRFFALEEDASLSLPPEANANSINDLGINTQSPAALGEQIVMNHWEIIVSESIRGQGAYALISETEPNFEAPESNWEYVLLKVQILYRNPDDKPGYASFNDFYAVNETGGKESVGPNYIYKPRGSDLIWLNYSMMPGATVEGWVILAVPSGRENIVLAYDPDEYSWDDSGESKRYFVIP
jgi:hypothetical protein